MKHKPIIHALVDKLDDHSKSPLFKFYNNKVDLEETLTYEDLFERASAAGSHLSELIQSGDKVVVVLTPGVSYIVALFSIFFAKGVAVPCYPPFAPNLAQQFKTIIEDCKPKLIVTDQTVLNSIERTKSSALFKAIPWLQYLISEDSSTANPFRNTKIIKIEDLEKGSKGKTSPFPEEDDIALLQYTSGSTGKAKGVILKHKNIATNSQQILDQLQLYHTKNAVFWLPPYHDMGLMGGILGPIYATAVIHLMAPATFLVRPFNWLKLISNVEGEVSAAPNFAYEFCVKKLKEEQIDELNLSSWKVALNGADYVREETLEQFYEKFKRAGFQKESFHPCYGMAEATLFLTGSPYKNWDVNDQIKRVSSGTPPSSIRIEIVDPETKMKLPEGTIGEIWAMGPNIAQGYYNNPELTQEMFDAYLKESGEGPFLRTGDLGYLKNGHLYVTGRMKDILIYRGRNFFPSDIETCYLENEEATKGSGVVFQTEILGDQKIILIQEVSEKFSDYENLAKTIHKKVLENFAIPVNEILFLPLKAIPRTTSGKLKRSKCKELYQKNELNPVSTVKF